MVEEVPNAFGRKCVYGKLYQGFESLSLRMNLFFVYILQSLKDNSFYIGECDDLDKRMSKHFDGMSKYSASKRPLRLRYFELLPTRSDAIKREKEIKRKKSRFYIEALIKNWLI
jgi:putative endonuclease